MIRSLLVALAVALSAATFAQDAQTPATRPVGTPQTTSASSDTTLLDDRHYVNSAGHVVHSPTHTNNGQAPAGATAKCGDGTYSFSESHRGTCSHHGGVAQWL